MAISDLAREDTYAYGDEPPAPPPLPQQSWRDYLHGIGSSIDQWAVGAPEKVRASADYYVGLPSRAMGTGNPLSGYKSENPYPPGSEEASFWDDSSASARNNWGINAGFGVVMDPLGVKRSVGASLGSGAGSKIIQPSRLAPETAGSAGGRLASPEVITAAAAESKKGITQPALRELYGELGLTGGEPSDLVKPSLAARQPVADVQRAIDLKLADRAFLDRLTPLQRREYMTAGKFPEGMATPSQEAARPALEAFAPVKKEVTRAEKSFDLGVERGNRPSIFDLSPQTLRQTPDVAQFPLPRVAPEATERLAPVARGGMGRLERAAAAAPESNWGWYNLMQQRDLLHSIHGPQKGEQAFQAWLDGVAGTSMVNPIDNNIRSSTWYLGKVLRGEPLPQVISLPDPVTGKMVKTMAGGPPPGYGAKSQIQHADRVREYMTHTYDPVSNPKPISYRMNLSGNWMPRTVDTHDIRNMVGMPRALTSFGAEDSALLPKEYSYLESVGQRAADRARTAQAPQQAATWVGGGEYTGLKSYPAPLAEALNRRAQVTAKVYGITPEQAMHDAYAGVRPLLGVGGTATMGALAAQDRYGED